MTLDEMEEALLKQGSKLKLLQDRLKENPLDSKAWSDLKYETKLHKSLLDDIQDTGLREIE